MMSQPASDTAAPRAFTHDQTFHAPRDLVFAAWSDPEQLARWWGPRGMSITVSEARGGEGGSARYAMGTGDHAMHGRFTYVEVTPPERLVIVDTRTDAAGEPLVDDAFPAELRYEVGFVEASGGTTVSLRVTPVHAGAAAQAAFEAHMDGLGGGFRGAFEKLAEHLGALQGHVVAAPSPQRRAFVYTRTVEAPRDLVFRAWTEREHLARWWGPTGMEVRVLHADVRPGGTFHYSMEQGGRLMWGRFAYREIVPPERLVYVNSFADAEGNVAPMPFFDGFPAEILHTVTFEEAEGRTTITLHAVPLDATPAEQASFEGLFTSMAGGFGGTFDQLAAHLAATQR